VFLASWIVGYPTGPPRRRRAPLAGTGRRGRAERVASARRFPQDAGASVATRLRPEVLAA
jgi:hypothetical protein